MLWSFCGLMSPAHFRLQQEQMVLLLSKHDKATVWLMSGMDTGKHVASGHNNFLLCGAKRSEAHPSMQRYCKQLLYHIAYIESNTFTISNRDTKFKFALVPSDMRWVASFEGEITNSAFYFSSFANANQKYKSTINGSLGTSNECK